jgi:hypothetical protein
MGFTRLCVCAQGPLSSFGGGGKAPSASTPRFAGRCDRRLSPTAPYGTIPGTVFLSLRFPIAGPSGGQESAMTMLIGFGTYLCLIALIYAFSDL